MKTLIGIVTFGNLPFTQLTLNELRRTTQSPVDYRVIVGQPGDSATAAWLRREGFPLRCHFTNRGFPASLNDLWDEANGGGYDNLILCGNDVIPYPGAVDAMIAEAARGVWEWICASQFDAKSLVARYPAARQFFTGEELRFTDFTARPWELHQSQIPPPRTEPGALKDVQNLCLFRRSVWEKLGYFDANFWPNGYFSDNDYARRAHLIGVRACGLAHAAYFHFWSRTIHQGEARPNGSYFARNSAYYDAKWGGQPEGEQWAVPFAGQSYELPGSRNGPTGQLLLPPTVRQPTRADEALLVRYWQSQG